MHVDICMYVHHVFSIVAINHNQKLDLLFNKSPIFRSHCKTFCWLSFQAGSPKRAQNGCRQSCLVCVSRTCLLILAISAMGGTWVLEQPRSSLVDWHPRVRLLFKLLPKVGGSKEHSETFKQVHVWLPLFKHLHAYHEDTLKVYEARWWACMYGAPTAKRHKAWSNSPTVQLLDLGRMVKALYRQNSVKSTRRYRSRRGKVSWCGSKHLKAAQYLVLA